MEKLSDDRREPSRAEFCLRPVRFFIRTCIIYYIIFLFFYLNIYIFVNFTCLNATHLSYLSIDHLHPKR